MADIVLSKYNLTFYNCTYSGGASALGTYESVTCRWNNKSTNGWVRSAAFTTGNYDVSSVTIQVRDCSKRAGGSGHPSVGISPSIDNWPTHNSIPLGGDLWYSYDDSNSLVDDRNCYEMTFNVNMKARTNYYLYLFTWGSNTNSDLGWQVFDHPSSSSDSRTSTIEITFNSYSYSEPKYTVTLNKGTGIASTSGQGTYAPGATVNISATPSSGYSFSKWTNSSGSTISTSNSYSFSMPSSNVTYTANATTASYNIIYDPGDYGSGSSSTVSKTHGSNITLKGSTFTRNGYTQTGWASDSAGTVKAYDLSATYSANASVRLYPYWTPVQYTLTIAPNGGSMRNGSSTTTSNFTTKFAYETKTYIGNLNSDNTYNTSNAPTRTGYKFDGFSFSGGSGQKNTSGEKFYFNGGYPGNGGTGSNVNSWVFNGNYTGNVVATAQWTGVTYYVQYNANGGTGAMGNSQHTYGASSALTSNAFTRSGYTFTGWNTKADGTGTSYSNGQLVSTLSSTDGATVQLYAQWGAGTYTINFDLNGGSVTAGNFSPMYCARGTSYSLPTGTLVKNNYVFSGWNTASNGSGTAYANGASVSNLAAVGASITLYAQWTAKKFTIKYNDNSSNKTTSIQYTATGTTNALSALPSGWTKSGYQASGWATSASATSIEYNFGQSFVGDLGVANNGTLNLYVVWTQQQPWTMVVGNIFDNTSKTFKKF